MDEEQLVKRIESLDFEPRKVVLYFGEKPKDFAANEKAEADKRRCQAFWEMVDSTPNLKSLIKSGVPFFPDGEDDDPVSESEALSEGNVDYESPKNNRKVKPLNKVEGREVDNPGNMSGGVPEGSRNMKMNPRILRARVEEKARFQRRREHNLELERKSGQRRLVAHVSPLYNKVNNGLSKEEEEELCFQEMKSYDEIKSGGSMKFF